MNTQATEASPGTAGSPKESRSRLLVVIIVLLCLVALFQLGILLQHHLAHPQDRVHKTGAPSAPWTPEDDIATIHARINEMFNDAFHTPLSQTPPAATPSPKADGGRAVPPQTDPFMSMREMQHQIDSLFVNMLQNREQLGKSFDEGWAQLEITPAFSVHDNGDAYEITVPLPGVDKSDIRISLENSILGLVVVQNHETRTSSPGRQDITSRHTSRFERHLRLAGATSRPEDIHATFQDDVLRITVPKAPAMETAPHPINIQ